MAKGENSDLDLAGGKKSSLLGLLMNTGIGLLLVAVNLGATFFLVNMMLEKQSEHLVTTLNVQSAAVGEGGAMGGADPAKPPLFISLDPPFVVNFGNIDQGRFLQTEIEVMTRDDMVGESIDNLKPMIRNAILLLLAHQNLETVGSRDAMGALQQQVQDEINEILQANGGGGGVEKVYFTSFVTQ